MLSTWKEDASFFVKETVNVIQLGTFSSWNEITEATEAQAERVQPDLDLQHSTRRGPKQ